jgi:N-methylhydantoinase A/oxoprolinase/acetone carboxylase beta subunit
LTADPSHRYSVSDWEDPLISVAVDIGGTFTDVVVLDDGRFVEFAKVPSTPKSPADGIVQGVLAALDRAGIRPEQVDRFAHGTTVATNAVLERNGAVVGLLATDGFEDTLEIGRMKRRDLYDLFIDVQTPVFLAPRRRREPIRERLDAAGNVLLSLDEEQVRRATRRLVEEEGVTAFAVCFLHAYRNGVHERRTAEIIREHYPDHPISLSSIANPQFREYERTCTTAFDAYLRPVMTTYIQTLVKRLAEAGVHAPVELMLSRGGLAEAKRAANRPVTLFLSGPAAGVLGASHEARLQGYPDAITLDMGGTSADVALVNGGVSTLRSEGNIDGYPVRTPMLDMTTVGAGGGSIAWIDAGGSLHVGPRSAGGDPGPVCYRRGGDQPTVTDASLVLGYLNPDGFGRNGLKLDRDAAYEAFRPLAAALGMDVLTVALGVHQVVNAAMADRIRLVSVKRGYDPRRYALVAFGGGGPLNGPALLNDLPIRGVLVPARPGVLSAIGLAWGATEHDSQLALHRRLADLTSDELHQRLAELDAEGRRLLKVEGIVDGVEAEAVAAVRYVGQSYELDVPVALIQGSPDAIGDAFQQLHEEVYGYANRGLPVEIVSLRVTHRRVSVTPAPVPTRSGNGRPFAERLAFFTGLDCPTPTPIYWRDDLTTDQIVRGPAVIEQEDSTTVVYPGQRATRLPSGGLFVEREETR